MPAATGFKLRDPALEYVGGKVEHFQQGRRRRAGLVQPGVECLFHGPAGFAQVGQSDHAAAALQRMVTAPDRDQCFVVAGVGVKQWKLLADGGQDFVGFLEENSEQFRVEVFLAGIHESRCFRRGRRRLDGGRRWRWGSFGRRGDAFHFEFRQGVRRRSYGVRHRQRCRFRVRRAVQRQFGQRFRGRRRHRCRRDFRFHGNGRFRDFRFRRSRLGDHWRRKYGVDVGRATLQLGDEETQCRELLRDVLELARLRRKTGLREALDSCRAFGEHGIGAILTEHQQGALNLAYRLLQSAQGGLARRIAEVGVERGFDGAEVAADFARHGFQQQPFLCPARHGVQVRQVEHAEFFATPEGGEPIDDGIGGMRELRVERLEVFKRGFGEQDGRGDFQRHDFVVTARVAAQLVGGVEDRGGQAPVVGLSGGGTLFGDLRGVFMEGRQGGSGSCAQAVPVILGGRQQFAQATDMGQQAFGFRWRRRRYHAIEAIGGAHDGQLFAAGGGAGGLVKRLAHGLRVGIGLALGELLDVRTKAHGEALCAIRVGQAIGGERVEDADGYPPVGARGG